MTTQEFEELYEKKHGMLRDYAKRHGTPEASEEMVQEVFLILWQKREKIAMDDNVMKWLIKALRYVMANYLRKKNNRGKFLSYEEADQYGEPDWGYGLVECEMLLKEYMSCRDLEMFLEFYGFGVPLNSIAEREGISAASLRTRLNRLKNKVKYDVINHNK